MQRYIFPRTPPSIYPILTRRGLLHIAVLVDQRQLILVLVSSIFKDGLYMLPHLQKCLVAFKCFISCQDESLVIIEMSRNCIGFVNSQSNTTELPVLYKTGGIFHQMSSNMKSAIFFQHRLSVRTTI